MGRIRTVKPEFWEDEKVGMLSRPARLLFLATFNLADDEGLLRWTPAFIKASVFMYDNDLDTKQITAFMKELSDAGLLFPYLGGVSHQSLAIIVNFRKHQKINRPQPGKLPPPSLQNLGVRQMYARRDNWICALCGLPIAGPSFDDAVNLSIDHVIHESKGGTDYPSNVRATHQNCNKSRGDRSDESFHTPAYIESLSGALNEIGRDSVNDSVNATPPPITNELVHAMRDSVPEGKGKEQGKEQGTGKGDSGVAPEPDSPPALRAAFSQDNDEAHMIATAVVDGIGVTTRWARDQIFEQAKHELKEHPGEMDGIRDGMVAAWKEYCLCAKAGKLRMAQTSPEKFFGEGKWKSSKLWGLKNGMRAYEGSGQLAVVSGQ